MRNDHVDQLRTIDPVVLGARIRTTRQRAGLTQSEVAGEEISVGYVSRIESGQRRPEAKLLAAIADRLSVTVDELLLGVAPDRVAELRLQLDHAELSLATGSPHEALEIVNRILTDVEVEELDDLRRDAGYARAGALEAVGDLQEAILVLEDLAETSPHDLAWIDGLTSLSRCYRESGELGRAIEVATEGVRRVEELQLGGVDEAIRLSLSLASAYFEQGDSAYAARLCRRAIDKAEAIASPMAKAMAYWNSSAIESLRGNAAAALPMTRRALEIIEASDDARNTARLRTQLGILQLLLDPPEPVEALQVLTHAADEMTTTGAGSADLADNRLAQARARFLLGDAEAARSQAIEIATDVRTTMPLLAADAHALLGRIAIDEDDEDALETARRHFQEAVLVLSGMGADRAAAQLWFELAGLLESVDEPAAALDAYRRAAAASGLVARSVGRAPAAATVPAATTAG